jgi:hypothetical protein
MRDLMNNLHFVSAIVPIAAAQTDNTALQSNIIDTQGYDSLAFAIMTGTLADVDATFTTLVRHGNESNLSDAVDVPDDMLGGSELLASFNFGDDNECRKIGYTGDKRYVRLVVTPANNTGAAPIVAIAVLGHPANAPTPNPPQ